MHLVIFLFLFTAMQAQEYHEGDLAVLKTIRDGASTEIGDPLAVIWADSADPLNWPGVTWSPETPRRVIGLNVSFKGIPSMDLTPLDQLTELQCDNNLMTSLQVANLSNLTLLDAGYNQLESLSLAGIANLGTLWVPHNRLTSLDLSGTPVLFQLNVEFNQLTSLDLSPVTNLRYFYASFNQLVTLSGWSGLSLYVAEITNNRLPFSQLIPPSLVRDWTYYQPQQAVFDPRQIDLGESIDYSSEAMVNGVATVFSWYRNYTLIEGAASATYTPTLAGYYTCQMTNEAFPGLTLETRPVTAGTIPEPYRNLIFTEVRMDDPRFNYIELTNMGTQSVNLQDFEMGSTDPWTPPWNPNPDFSVRLPDRILAPGESFLIASITEVPSILAQTDPMFWIPSISTSKEMNALADLKLYIQETEWGWFPEIDRVEPGYRALESWQGRNAIYLRHHYFDGLSVVTDAINASFYSNSSPYKSVGPSSAAGVDDATGSRILVRKYGITEGLGDALDSWFNSAGVGIDDSDWLPLPFNQKGFGFPDRLEYRTLKNHGNYIITRDNLTSPDITIDFDALTMTIPWGVRKFDGVIKHLDALQGLAWNYHSSAEGDNLAYNSVKTNDIITLYSVGTTLQQLDFQITALPPTDNDHLVIPLNLPNTDGTWDHPRMIVSEGQTPDTISNVAFATPVDSLLKYLEKPGQATWEIVFADANTKDYVQTGDLLRVTAANGPVKDYYIRVNPYKPGTNALLATITWPDVPRSIMEAYGWTTINLPGFAAAKTSYTLEIPWDYPYIPVLTGQPQDPNATLIINRATSLAGTEEERTITFTCIAEDGVNSQVYTVLILPGKDPGEKQPLVADPFISQFVFRDQWANSFIEVVNPGNQPLDLSNYMFAWGYVNSPAEAITRASGSGDWGSRYVKYIPGYRWVDQSTWQSSPAMVVPDPLVEAEVSPGDVFAISDIRAHVQSGYPWFASEACDVDLGIHNPWGESTGCELSNWVGANYYLFRILNDSIKQGLKPANDPNDFTLLDVFGSGDGTTPVVGGFTLDQIMGFTRKPHIQKGNPVFKGSFGSDPESSEWAVTNRNFWIVQGYSWPMDILMIAHGLGNHNFNEITSHLSTVTSVVYRVSSGYSLAETIKAVVSGTTVGEFLSGIIKADPGQQLQVYSFFSEPLSDGDELLTNAYLEVTSADGHNMTRYYLEVSEEGLSDNALLTSATLTISFDGAAGDISGFELGTGLPSLFSQITVPPGATVIILDSHNTAISMTFMDAYGQLHDVTATGDLYLEVTAENGTTRIYYALSPGFSSPEAYVLSDLYVVDRGTPGIYGIPRNTSADVFMSGLIIPPGVQVQLQDKTGFPRSSGFVACGDRLLVTNTASGNSAFFDLFITGVCDALPENMAPVANAGPDQFVEKQTLVTLDGSASFDPDSDALTYLWLAPAGIVLSAANILSPTFSAPDVPADTPLTFTLIVNDGKVNSTSDEVTITVLADNTISLPVSLSSGWNLVSANNQPDSPGLDLLFDPLIQSGNLVKVMDEQGRTLEDLGGLGGWSNAIGNLSHTEGYKVKVTGDCVLTFEGDPVPLPCQIPLTTGWNIIGFPGPTHAHAMDVIGQLITRGTLIKVQDETGKSLEDFGSFGGWQNFIGSFSPGEGYKVKVNAPEVLTIVSSYPKAAALSGASQPPAVHFIPAGTGNGVDHMNINLVGLSPAFLSPGDELGIFDGELCVGAITVIPGHLGARMVSIPASATDHSGTRGFTPGNTVVVKLWQASTGEVKRLEPDPLKGSLTFRRNESLFASLEKYALTPASLNETQGVHLFPNPTSGKMHISFGNDANGKALVSVMNPAGQKLLDTTLETNPGEIDLSGQAPGLYTIRITGRTTTTTHKVILR